jgi:hypothetical protein
MINLFKPKRRKPIYKTLEEKYGGKWTYNKRGTWWCDDNKRHVSRVAMCFCDEWCKCPTEYFMYGDGIPERVYLW